MNCIVIDDDKLTCGLIEEFINQTDGLQFIASFHSAQDTLLKSKSLEDIDLLFLDVEMPDMSGFDFLKRISNPPIVIIMSSNESYALDAFSFAVTDFLLKPVEYSRFLKACDRAKSMVIQKINDDNLFIKVNRTHSKVFYCDIYYVEALENYCIFHTKTDKMVILQSMKQIEQKLPQSIFRRCHRSYIINLTLTFKIEDTVLILKVKNTKIKIPLSRLYKTDVLKAYNCIN